MATTQQDHRDVLTLRFGRNILADERAEHPIGAEPQPLKPSMIHALTDGEENVRFRRKAEDWKRYAHDDYTKLCTALVAAAKAARGALQQQGEALRSVSTAGEYYTRYVLQEAGGHLTSLRHEHPTLVRFLVEPPIANALMFEVYLDWIVNFFAEPPSAPTP